MGYFELILISGLMWLVQIVFTLQQQKHIRSTLAKVQSSYSSGYLGTGVTRSKLNFGPGVLLIVVLDEYDAILDFQVLSGLTVFTRFKKLNQHINKKVDDICFNKREKKIQAAFEQAINQIDLVKQAT